MGNITWLFKAKATKRKKRKNLKRLKTKDGSVIYEVDDIIVEFMQYFNSLFSSQVGGDQVDWDMKMRAIHHVVTTEMNNSRLVEPYTEEEICRALF